MISNAEREFKKKSLFEAIHRGKTVKVACREFNVNYSTARAWISNAGIVIRKPKAPGMMAPKVKTSSKPKVRFVLPPLEPIEGHPDPIQLRKFVALINTKERTGSAGAVFVSEDWNLILQAKLAAQMVIEAQQ